MKTFTQSNILAPKMALLTIRRFYGLEPDPILPTKMDVVMSVSHLPMYHSRFLRLHTPTLKVQVKRDVLLQKFGVSLRNFTMPQFRII